MNALLPALGLAVLAAVMSALSGWFLIHSGVKDTPQGEHKDHAQPHPTSGGMAVFAAVFPLTILLWFIEPQWSSFATGVLLAGGLYMFIMGVWDDIVVLPAVPKLIAQLVLALAVCALGVRVDFIDLGRHVFELGFLIGILGSAAWFIVVTNAVNFMDGSDGLAIGSCAVIAAALAFLATLTGVFDIAALALILLGGLLGLLFWNGRGKLFAGDSGSLFAGFYLAGLTLLWVQKLDLSVWLAPCLFIGFLTDVLLTLIWRFQHKRNLLQAHKEHVFQLMLKAGVKHPVVAWIYVWIAVHGALIAGISLVFPRGGAMIGFIILFGILYMISRRIRRSAINHGHLIVEDAPDP